MCTYVCLYTYVYTYTYVSGRAPPTSNNAFFSRGGRQPEAHPGRKARRLATPLRPVPPSDPLLVECTLWIAVHF